MKKFAKIYIVAFIICFMSTNIISVSQASQTQTMAHWANIRDESYNIIGRVEEGENVTVGNVDSNDPSRTWVTTSDGIRGTVSTVYIYGGSQADYDDPWGYEPDTTGWDSIKYDDDRVIEVMLNSDNIAGEANNDEINYSGSGEFNLEVSDGILYFYHDGNLVLTLGVTVY